MAWQTRGRYRYVQVRCPVFNEILHTLWHYYYVYVFGSVHALTDAHALVDEKFVYSILIFYLFEIVISITMGLLHVIDLTSMVGGRGREGTVAA